MHQQLGRAQATDDEVRAAARAAHADEFIAELPEGYDTVAGELLAREGPYTRLVASQLSAI